MATFDYVILSDSEGNRIKRFKTIKYIPPRQRTDSFKITLGGKLDKSAGTILLFFQYTFKVPASVSDPNYGTLDDIIYFFDLNSPNGSPSDLLTLVDHYGATYHVKFRDEISPEPLTTQLEGPNAWHFVNVNFIKVEVTGS